MTSDELGTLEEIRKETYSAYNRGLENIKNIDSKIVQIFTIITALIVIFLSTLKFSFENIVLSSLSISTIALLAISLFVLIRAYRPLSYKAIDSNTLIENYSKGKYKNREQLIQVLIGTTAENIDSLKENIKKKSKHIDVSIYLTISSFVLIIFLKLIQGG